MTNKFDNHNEIAFYSKRSRILAFARYVLVTYSFIRYVKINNR